MYDNKLSTDYREEAIEEGLKEGDAKGTLYKGN